MEEKEGNRLNIIRYLHDYHIEFDINLENDEIDKIYDLYFNKKVDDNLTSYVSFYYGIYYQMSNQNEEMNKYYHNSGLDIAMYHLFKYYENKNDYDNMLKHIMIGVNKHNIFSIIRLGQYYDVNGIYDKMIECYLKAIKLGSSYAACLLGRYFERVEDIKNMIYNYLLANEMGNSNGLVYLGDYYWKMGDYDNMIKNHKIAEEKGNTNVIPNLGKYNDEILEKTAISFTYSGNCRCKRLLAYKFKKDKDIMNMINNLSSCSKNHDIIFMMLLGDFYKNFGDFDKSIKYYLMAINDNNFFQEYYDIGNYNQVIAKCISDLLSFNDARVWINLGDYYWLNSDYDQAVKFYLMAIENGDTHAMTKLAHYYYLNGNVKKSIEYYGMCIEKGDERGIISMMKFYNFNEKQKILKKYREAVNAKDNDTIIAISKKCKLYAGDEDTMNFYILDAEENIKSVRDLGCYFKFKKNYNEMIKYYKIGTKKDDIKIMLKLENHYMEVGGTDDEIMEIHTKILKTGYEKEIHRITQYYVNECGIDLIFKWYINTAANGYYPDGLYESLDEYKITDEFVRMKTHIKKLKKKIAKQKIYITELEYSPSGIKYNETKDHFESLQQFP